MQVNLCYTTTQFVKVIVSWWDDSMSSHDVNSERNEGTEGVEVLVRVFITFVLYAQVDECLFLVLFTEGIQYYVRSSKMGCSSWKNRVLVKRLVSQLREGNPSEAPHLATTTHGNAARSGSGAEARQAERDFNANEKRGIQRIGTMRISKDTSAGEMLLWILVSMGPYIFLLRMFSEEMSRFLQATGYIESWIECRCRVQALTYSLKCY
ncbi:hypothetical protein Peur_012381 [Populus x canadensis]